MEKIVTKKQRQIIVGIIILALVLVVFREPLSVIIAGNRMSCSDGLSNSWDCVMDGFQPIGGSGEKMYFTITSPSDANQYHLLSCEKLNQLTGQSCPVQEPTQPSSTWRFSVGTLVNNTFGDQLVIIKGTSTEGDYFETYGLCDGVGLSRNGWIYDPFPDQELELNAESIKIYFKVGGYVESDSCTDYNVGCNPITVYRFQNNECTELSIFEKFRTNNDYDTLAECELNIVNLVTIYRFENGVCNQYTIFERDILETDFESLEECKSSIEQPVTTNILLIIGLLVFVSILIFALVKWRK